MVLVLLLCPQDPIGPHDSNGATSSPNWGLTLRQLAQGSLALPHGHISLASADSSEDEEGGDHQLGSFVLPLTDDNLEAETKSGHVFILFYAEWCGHCKRLMPLWSQLAEELKDNPQLSIAAILATENKRNPGSSLVRGYPTLLWFHEGQPVAAYEGDRSEASLYKFIDEMLSLEAEQLAASKVAIVESMASKLEEQQQQQAKAEEEMKKTEGEFAEVIVEVKDETWKVQLEGKDAVLFYYASWCVHCGYYKAPLVYLQKQMAAASNTKNVFVGRIDVSDGNRLNPGMTYVTGVPAVLFAHNGEVIDLFSGSDFEKLGKWIYSLIGLSPDQVKEKKEGLLRVVEERREVIMREEQQKQDERRKMKEEELRKARLKKRRGRG